MYIDKTVRIAANPSRVWNALTGPQELMEWFADDVNIEAKSYALSGTGILMESMKGSIRMHVVNRQFEVDWELDGAMTTVSILLNPIVETAQNVWSLDHQNPSTVEATFCELRIIHDLIPDSLVSFSAQPDEFLETVWTMWLRQLKAWIERGERLPWFEFKGAGEVTKHLSQGHHVLLQSGDGSLSEWPIETTFNLSCPVDVAWHCISNPDVRHQWLHIPMGIERFREEGRILEQRWMLETTPSIVRFECEPVSSRLTRVTIRQNGLPDGALFEYQLSWHNALQSLKVFAEESVVSQTVWLPCDAETLWPLISSSDGLSRWWSPEAAIDHPRIAGNIRFGDPYTSWTGIITDFRAPYRLACAIRADRLDEPGTLLLLMEVGEPACRENLNRGDMGVRLSVRLSGFETFPPDIGVGLYRFMRIVWSKSSFANQLMDCLFEFQQ